MARWKPWPCITLPRECFVFEINSKFWPIEFLGFTENRRKTLPTVQIALWGVFSEIPTSYRFFCRSHSSAPLHRGSKAAFNFKCREQSLKVVHDIIFAIKRQNSSENYWRQIFLFCSAPVARHVQHSNVVMLRTRQKSIFLLHHVLVFHLTLSSLGENEFSALEHDKKWKKIFFRFRSFKFIVSFGNRRHYCLPSRRCAFRSCRLAITVRFVIKSWQ